MRDVIEAAFNVSIQDIFVLAVNFLKDGFDSIMASSSRSESITIGFKFGLPFRLQGLLDQRLVGSVAYDGNAQRALFQLAWFGYPDPANRLCFPLSLSLRVKLCCQGQSFHRREGSLSVYACGLFYPGYLASLVALPTVGQTVTASITVAIGELPGRCHVLRLDRFAFVAGSNAALASARAAGSSLHSPYLAVTRVSLLLLMPLAAI